MLKGLVGGPARKPLELGLAEGGQLFPNRRIMEWRVVTNGKDLGKKHPPSVAHFRQGLKEF
jgi:hypothetical protein